MSREILVDALPGEVVMPVTFDDEAKLRRAKHVVGRRAERGWAGAHNNPALDVAQCTGLRQALEPLWHADDTVVACRRNVPDDPRQVGVA